MMVDKSYVRKRILSIVRSASLALVAGLVLSVLTVGMGYAENGTVGQNAPSTTASETTNVSISIVVDVSGSMDNYSALNGLTKLESAKQQSIAFVKSSVRDEGGLGGGGLSTRVGVCSFATQAQTVCGLSGDSDEVANAINSLVASGRTNIYGGLSEGVTMLKGEAGTKILLFLSDGISNEGLGESDILALADEASSAGITIYTIGFGSASDLDSNLLTQIAERTGGTYAHEDSSDISSAAVGLFATMMDAQLTETAQLLQSATGSVEQNGTTHVGSYEVPSTGTMTAYLYWPGSALDLELIDPEGVQVKDGYPGYSVDTSVIPTKVTVLNAKKGTWDMSVFGREVSMAKEPFYAAAAFVQTATNIGGGGGSMDSGPILLLLLGIVAAGSLLGVYALSTRRN